MIYYAQMQKVITWSYYLLFLLAPLVFYSHNYELFEYNKMVLTYAFTIIISSAWVIKMAISKKIEVRRTPFDKLLLLFLLSQIVSTIFSIDTHVSIFGYYSRFHQGLLATLSYIILYFAFTSNFPKEKIKNLLYFSFASALIVSMWGIFEHFGHSLSCLIITHSFDDACWIQDVQTRVFATLGQPNWMSAYLAILIPISIGLCLENIIKTVTTIKEKSKKALKIASESEKITSLSIFFLLISVVFYIAFLYTRSRSGFAALWIGLFVFAMRFLTKTSKTLILVLIILSSLTFLIGSGIAQLDRFSLPELTKSAKESAAIKEVYQAPALEGGGTESGKIRAIVWKGALDIFRHYPIVGSGVETFAYSYYQFRPVEHNMVSEWDFLYNKAHNEYLNFLATTGLFGFLTYMGFIIAFIVWFIKKSGASNVLGAQPDPSQRLGASTQNMKRSEFAMFAGWLTILITNFFGFSVVIVALYFYLIPAVVFLNTDTKPVLKTFIMKRFSNLAILFSLLFFIFSFHLLYNYYSADIEYAKGNSLAKDGQYKDAYLFLISAIEKNPLEPAYHDEISTTLASIAVEFSAANDKTSAEKFASLALKESNIATSISPNNVTFYKSKTKMFYTLSSLDQSYIPRAIDALKRANQLSPTDPKILYNLAILQSKMKDLNSAVSLLKKAVDLKPDYRDGRYALALMYKDSGEPNLAIDELQYILKNISSADSEVQDKLKSWQ